MSPQRAGADANERAKVMKKAFESLGVAVPLIDHQAKGDGAAASPYGPVFMGNFVRGRLGITGELSETAVTLTHQKTNRDAGLGVLS